MVFSRVFSAALVVALLLAQGEPAEATPESRAGALFLLISPSVRVNGMGRAGVALPDEPAGYYNPGAAALSSPAHMLQSRFYLSEMPWLTAFADDISYNYFAAQAATERVLDGFLGLDSPTKLRAAFYGYRTKIDLGEQIRTDERGNQLGTVTSAEASNNIGISLALRSVVEVGFGATTKWISSDLALLEHGAGKGSARAYDFGLIAVVPVVGVWERLTGREFKPLQPKLDVGLGVMWQNRGGETIIYPDVLFADPLPANRRHGWSGSLGMDWNSDSFNLAIGRVTFSTETYRPQIDGVPVTNLAEDDKCGFEVSILETVAIRRGTYDDFDGKVHLKTSGWTVKSDGLFKFFAHQLDSTPSNSEGGALQFLARHLSISWSRFDYGDRSSSLFRGVGHSFIGLSF